MTENSNSEILLNALINGDTSVNVIPQSRKAS